MKTFAGIIIFTFLIINNTTAQRIHDNNTIGWFTTTISPKINNKWSGHIEYQWRRNDIVKTWQQSLMRLGINYKINDNVAAHVGYGWIESFPFGEPNILSVPKRTTEHRIYQQLILKNKFIGSSTFTHRFRFEERWVGRFTDINQKKEEEFVFLLRARYAPRIETPTYKGFFKNQSDKGLYAAAAGELFIGFGKNIGENVFDQNRIIFLLGYKFSKKFKLEAGYLNVIQQLGREVNGSNVFQHNNGLLVNTVFDL